MAIFISDCHLGNRNCKANLLVAFLEKYNSEDTIVLVGDIIDDHQLSIWPESHKKALGCVLGFKRIVYLPGNHDAFLRHFYGNYANISILEEVIYMTTNGKRYLVIHGDRQDIWTKYTSFLSVSVIARLTRYFFENIHAKIIGRDSRFKRQLIKLAKEKNLDGVICGHNHYPEICANSNVLYINCGDWIDSCMGIVEKDGVFELSY